MGSEPGSIRRQGELGLLPPPGVRSTAGASTILRMARLLRAGPYLLPAAVAAFLAWRWERLPARYPVHWGVDGPDRWADLSAWAVARPLLFGLLVTAWLGWLRRFLLRNSAPAQDEARSRALVDHLTTATQWTVSLAFGLGSVPQQNPGLAVSAAGAGLLLVPLALVVTYAGKPRREAPASPPADGWLLVPKRVGVGLAIDFGHPRAWRALGLILAGPAAFLLLGLLL